MRDLLVNKCTNIIIIRRFAGMHAIIIIMCLFSDSRSIQNKVNTLYTVHMVNSHRT